MSNDLPDSINHQAKERLDESTAPSGIAGLDDILRGGFPRGCLTLITGTPGTGKTTLAMQFLLEGVKANESSLYIALSETQAEIEKVAASHGWNLNGIHLKELVA